MCQIMAWSYMNTQVYLTAKPKGNVKLSFLFNAFKSNPNSGKRKARFQDTFFTVDKVFPPSTNNYQANTAQETRR